jgi:DNA invertase Pin-like site-specific DNA recombinase
MIRAVSYLRVSTDKQADSGLGLEAQRSAVQSSATRLGFSLVGEFVDAGVSGSLAAVDRPTLMGAITSLGRGDVLIVAKRDRLGRDVIEVAMIERLILKRRARLVSAAGEGTESADDPSSWLQRTIIDSFAEFERRVIARRTKDALGAKRAKGERVSRFLPFGYRLASNGRTLEPEPLEQAIIATVGELREAGYSLQDIADELNRQGSRTRSGAYWKRQYVHRLSSNRAVA